MAVADQGLRAVLRDRVCAAAAARAGLDDFGPADFHEGLDALTGALGTDLGLEGGELEAAAVASTAVALSSRLHSQAAWQRSGAGAPVRAPVVIAGLPRTGTTALHQLLARDDRFQGLESWLLRTPMPRPPRAMWPQFASYREQAEEAQRSFRSLGAIHWVDAGDFDECQLLMAQSLVSNTFGSQRSVPSYDEWYLAQDYTDSFRRLRANLALIGSGEHGGRRWLLKNPSHLFSLDALLRVFPDAVVVITHRDPLGAVPSLASLLWVIRRSRLAAAPDLDPRLIGARECRMWAVAAARMMDLDARRPGRLVHVFQHDLVARPQEVLRAVYAAAGMEFRPSAGPPPATAGAPGGQHTYRAADFGLTREALSADFAEYRARFGFSQ